MIKLFFLLVFFLMGSYPLKADEKPGGYRDFLNELNAVKDPFQDGLPKPVVIIQQPVKVPQQKPEKPLKPPKPKVVVAPVIALPKLQLQGVIVGGGIHEAIVDDKVVPLQGAIEGARILSVSKKGIELLYKGKKFFLKVD